MAKKSKEIIMEWNITSWFTYNNFYKGTLENLEIHNKGDCYFKKYTDIDLYTKDGKFYKTISETEHKTEFAEFALSKYNIYYSIIQINYEFYKIPIPERHQIQDGRNQTKELLKKLGIKGFDNNDKLYYEEYSKLKNRVYIFVDYPIENVYSDVCIRNTKSFINFDYKIYIENYKKALKKFPEHIKEIEYLKDKNLKIICDFYDIELSILQKKKFDRLKYAIRLLNKKINNKIK